MHRSVRRRYKCRELTMDVGMNADIDGIERSRTAARSSSGNSRTNRYCNWCCQYRSPSEKGLGSGQRGAVRIVSKLRRYHE